MSSDQSQVVEIALNGARGRMGRQVALLAVEESGYRLASALVRPDDPELGSDAGLALGMGYDLGVTLESRIDTDCGATVLVDFSVAAAVADRLEEAAGLGLAAVICTTGLDDDSSRRIEAAATRVPVLVAANTSVGITVMRRVAADLSRMLGEDFDVEISETHHRFKKDSPSGTALALVDAVAQARAVDPVRDVVHGRQGTSPRRTGEIGVHARRMGDVVGEHTVAFSALGERIELTHRAHSRETFARGALRAAQWLQGRQPGLYTMDDVLAESSI